MNVNDPSPKATRLSLGLFGKIYLLIALASIALIWLVMLLSEYTETQFSTIAVEHQQQLRVYAEQAEALVKRRDNIALKQWVDGIGEQESTWLGVIRPNPDWLAGEPDYSLIDGKQNLIIGRNIEWPIHLHHHYNPIMRMTLGDTGYSLMIQLPQRMRPGAYWNLLNTLITMGLPILLVAVLSYIIYRHIISPLQKLQQATQRFSDGDYQVRTANSLSKRHDELSELALSFDSMADRIGNLLTSQRQLIQDISHELRTPITRIKLVLSKPDVVDVVNRVEHEINGMQALMEDTLTLSWLDTEKPILKTETVDLCLLLETIVEDARFEFPDHHLTLVAPDSCEVKNSSHRAVGQALENIIRNALKYSPMGGEVTVHVSVDSESVTITVNDCGPGVDDEHLEKIFEPFFRVDKSRAKDSGGFGLGLALSRRQLISVGGRVRASHNGYRGLRMEVQLPLSHVG